MTASTVGAVMPPWCSRPLTRLRTTAGRVLGSLEKRRRRPEMATGGNQPPNASSWHRGFPCEVWRRAARAPATVTRDSHRRFLLPALRPDLRRGPARKREPDSSPEVHLAALFPCLPRCSRPPAALPEPRSTPPRCRPTSPQRRLAVRPAEPYERANPLTGGQGRRAFPVDLPHPPIH